MSCLKDGGTATRCCRDDLDPRGTRALSSAGAGRSRPAPGGRRAAVTLGFFTLRSVEPTGILHHRDARGGRTPHVVSPCHMARQCARMRHVNGGTMCHHTAPPPCHDDTSAGCKRVAVSRAAPCQRHPGTATPHPPAALPPCRPPRCPRVAWSPRPLSTDPVQ